MPTVRPMAQSRPKPLPRLEEPNDRLKWARQQAYPDIEDATAAAKRFGWNVSTYLSHENGNRGLTRKSALKYGRRYRVAPEWIMFGDDAMAPADPELMTLWGNLSEAQQQTIKQLMRDIVSRAA